MLPVRGSPWADIIVEGPIMASTKRVLRPAGVLGVLCLAAGLAVAGSGTAQAATGNARADVARPGTTATVTFTRIGSGRSPRDTFDCSVTYPYVTDTFSTGQISWTSQVSCNIAVHMQGTTAIYQWGNGNAYAFGSSYNNTSTLNTSSGSVTGIHSGEWGVNNNVDFFPPVGYTTTLGAGCYYVNGSTTDIHCTATTGPITAG